MRLCTDGSAPLRLQRLPSDRAAPATQKPCHTCQSRLKQRKCSRASGVIVVRSAILERAVIPPRLLAILHPRPGLDARTCLRQDLLARWLVAERTTRRPLPRPHRRTSSCYSTLFRRSSNPHVMPGPALTITAFSASVAGLRDINVLIRRTLLFATESRPARLRSPASSASSTPVVQIIGLTKRVKARE